MARDLKSDLNEAARAAAAAKRPEPAEVPERIRKHAPAPQLRPDGSWGKQADQVDRRVREEHEAQKAKSNWANRTEAQQSERLGRKFNRSMS